MASKHEVTAEFWETVRAAAEAVGWTVDLYCESDMEYVDAAGVRKTISLQGLYRQFRDRPSTEWATLVADHFRTVSARTTTVTVSRFRAGQVWKYQTRPGEWDSLLTVVLVEDHEKLGTIVHIRVDGLAQRNPHAPGGVNTVVHHMPFAAEAMDRSVVQLVLVDAPVPASYAEGYGIWKEAFDKGEASIFTITVAEALTTCEQALNQVSDRAGEDNDGESR
jgi:hypothetical protein